MLFRSNGGVEGGIKVGGKRYSIIHFWMNANGEIVGAPEQPWQLNAAVGIHYSIDLWIDEIEGSVTWHVRKDF